MLLDFNRQTYIYLMLFTDESKLGMLLRFNLRLLRSVFILPVILMLILVFGSVLTSVGILYYVQAPHLRGGLLLFENQYVELEFPKNWYGVPYETSVPSSGKNFSVLLTDPAKIIYIGLMIYDETSTQTFLNNLHLTDARSVINFMANVSYYGIMESSSNATLVFIENSTKTVSGHTADCSIFKILNGYTENNVAKNISYMMLSYFDNQRLVQIAYWGGEEDFESSFQVMETFITNLMVKT